MRERSDSFLYTIFAIMKNIQISIAQRLFNFKEIPDTCPECHQNIYPIVKNSFAPNNSDKHYVFFACPSSICAVGYTYEFQKFNQTDYIFKRFICGTVETRNFSNHITGLSNNFCKIFREAEAAEKLNLKEICGVGYRKSLEFLIKDYLISINTERTEQIQKSLLGKCINDYVSNDNIKNTAKRAAWLGNDQTHYVKIWEEKDLKDLKLLIDLTVHWIEMELITKGLMQDMPD